MEQYFQEQVTAQCENTNNSGLLKNWKSVSQSAVDDELENTNTSGGFECNICLESVLDPVVTMCGHLYCWPCIYKWIHYQTSSSENGENQQPQCPVCKVQVSEKTLIPLYGRGRGLSAKPSSDGTAQNLGMIVPQRPPSPRCTGTATPLITTTANRTHPPHHRWSYDNKHSTSNGWDVWGNVLHKDVWELRIRHLVHIPTQFLSCIRKRQSKSEKACNGG